MRNDRFVRLYGEAFAEAQAELEDENEDFRLGSMIAGDLLRKPDLDVYVTLQGDGPTLMKFDVENIRSDGTSIYIELLDPRSKLAEGRKKFESELMLDVTEHLLPHSDSCLSLNSYEPCDCYVELLRKTLEGPGS